MKVIAIIKEMPKDCDECPFVNENRDCILLGAEAFPNDWVEDAPYYSLKEKGDCPLRPLPDFEEKLDLMDFVRESDFDTGFRFGWNAYRCKLTGEE